jgi:beta-lactam-binding protein with PASTA domain
MLAGLAVFGAGAASGFVLFHDRPSRPQTNYSAADVAGAHVDCQASGSDAVSVPDVIGQTLAEAIARVWASGLQVVGTGTPFGDSTSPSAVVRAQKPSAAARVPAGACVGFRTGA